MFATSDGKVASGHVGTPTAVVAASEDFVVAGFDDCFGISAHPPAMTISAQSATSGTCVDSPVLLAVDYIITRRLVGVILPVCICDAASCGTPGPDCPISK